jgi:hypothetical protein
MPFEFLLGVMTPMMSAVLPVRIEDAMLLLRDMYPATFETVPLDNNEVDADLPLVDLDGVRGLSADWHRRKRRGMKCRSRFDLSEWGNRRLRWSSM